MAARVHAGVDVALRDGSTIRVRPTRAEDRARRARVPRRPLGGVALAALLRRRRQPRRRGAPSRSTSARAVVARRRDRRRRPRRSGTASTSARAPTPPRSPSRSRTTGTGTASPRCCSPTWPMRRLPSGIDTFTAVVLPSNHRMIGVFRDSGYPVEVRSGPDEIEVSFPTVADAGGPPPLRGARADRRRGGRRARAAAGLRGGRRRLAPARDRRRRGAAQPGRRRLHRAAVRGQPARGRDRRRPRRPRPSAICPSRSRWR